jgi:hypothetical protein
LKKIITWRQKLGRDECPYAERWILDFGLGTLRVHHFFRSDDKRNFHDHPWWFLTLVVRGGYTDVSPDGEDHLTPGKVRFRRAHHRHTVATDPGGVWTIVLTGRKKRTWGFWVPRKDGSGTIRFMKSLKYFYEHGHHPCDQP